MVDKDNGEREKTDEIAIVLKVDVIDNKDSGSKENQKENSERSLRGVRI